MRKVRVLHCIAALERGGAERQLQLLLRNYDGARFEMAVLCLDDHGREALPSRVSIVVIPRGKKWNVFALAKRIGTVIRSYSPDILHLWLPELVTIPAAITGLLNSYPILSAHRRSPSNQVSVRQWIRDRMRYIPHIVASKMVTNFDPSIARAPVFNWLFRRKNGRVIPNAIDAESIAAMPSKYLDSNSEFDIIYAGRFVEQKRVDLLMQAVGDLVAQGQALTLHVFGKGKQEKQLREMATGLGLEGHVRFHGFRTDWLSLAKSADLFVLPSVCEGMPNVLLEACASGLPVLAARIPAVTAIFEHGKTAWLVEPNSASALREGIAVLHSAPAIRSKLADTAQSILQQYSLEQMVEAYSDIYAQMIAPA